MVATEPAITTACNVLFQMKKAIYAPLSDSDRASESAARHAAGMYAKDLMLDDIATQIAKERPMENDAMVNELKEQVLQRQYELLIKYENARKIAEDENATKSAAPVYEEEKECMICMGDRETTGEMVHFPCGHRIMCESCWKMTDWELCLMCKQKLNKPLSS